MWIEGYQAARWVKFAALLQCYRIHPAQHTAPRTVPQAAQRHRWFTDSTTCMKIQGLFLQKLRWQVKPCSQCHDIQKTVKEGTKMLE